MFNSLYFLILSHHKLPHHNGNEISEQGYFNKKNIEKPIQWVANSPFDCDEWLKALQKQCHDLCQQNFDLIYDNIEAFTSAILYIARPALVITDQNVSYHATTKAKSDNHKGQDGVVYANTYKDEHGQNHMAQPLNAHLFQVSDGTKNLSNFMLQDIHSTCLPSLQYSPSTLTKPTTLTDFTWQNTAVSIAESLPASGNLILISAETGAGKTRANKKVASALRNHEALRVTTLLGMNTLTKQTATEYINDIGLGNSACAITGHAITRLGIERTLEHANGCENLDTDDFNIDVMVPDQAGLQPTQFDLPKNLQCHFKPKYDQILATPIVIATIDHLIEGVQSGKSTATRLLQRLQTSDLIIDEIDSYSASSLVPIYKLVYLAGLFHRNLIVSSATLRPAVATTLVELFQRGLDHHNNIFETTHSMTGAVISNYDGATFTAHNSEEFNTIINKQRKEVLNSLLNKTVKRRLNFIDAANAKDIFSHAKTLHHAHCVSLDEFKFSAGVIRLNNVKYVQAFARALGKLSDPNIEIAVISYHSRIAAPVRYRVENCLDKILKRTNTSAFRQALLSEKEFMTTIEKARKHHVRNIMLLVVCSPIEETGRDHDFDYGITEPCSNHSLIQLAGRIRRHRPAVDLTIANMLMLNHSLKEQYEPKQKPYLSMPGAETQTLRLFDGTKAETAFSGEGINYKQAIDARACLINYTKQKIREKRFSNLNEIEVQQAHNASFNISDFIDNSHQRISETHALNFPLRESNNDIPVWYNGEEWVMPSNTNKHDKSGKTEQCNWNYDTEKLPNLWFNQDINSILSSICHDSTLKKLLCSQHSSFGLTSRQNREMRNLSFNYALGLFNPNDRVMANI